MGHVGRELVRIATAGHVDDGKSTLIGRLLYDADRLDEVQSARLEAARVAGHQPDFAGLVDGLRAEREQGITIDVAYRYFSSPKRSYILADTPGHVQYTRNMATGASNADIALILIDARHGLRIQSKRHAFIASLLRVPHFLIVINKMDLVDYQESVFRKICDQVIAFAAKLDIHDMRFVPVSALHGDMVVGRGKTMEWYRGLPLLDELDGIYIGSDRNLVDLRFPIQWVNRSQADFRGYAGTLASGVLRRGADVMVLPSRVRSRVQSIVTFDGELEEVRAPMAITITLADEVDLGRGDLIVSPNNQAQVSSMIEAMLIWMDETPFNPKSRYLIKHTTQTTTVTVEKLYYKIDISHLHRAETHTLELNDIGRVRLLSFQPLKYDPYRRNRTTGSFILIDQDSNRTAAAGMIIDRETGQTTSELQSTSKPFERGVTPEEVYQRLGYRPCTLWLTGPVSSGKAELAKALERELFDRGYGVTVLDGGSLRRSLNRDLGFDPRSIDQHIRSAAAMARHFNQAGLIVICSFVSPFAESRSIARTTIGPDQFFELYMERPLAAREDKDQSGLYALARKGHVTHLAGFNSPYQPPEQPILRLPIDELEMTHALALIFAKLEPILQLDQS